MSSNKTKIDGVAYVAIRKHERMMDCYNELIRQQSITISELNGIIKQIPPSKMEIFHMNNQLKLDIEEKDEIIESQRQVIEILKESFYDKEITKFFLQIRLDHCIAIFNREQIDFDLLQHMTKEQFIRLGVTEHDYDIIKKE